MGPVRVRVLPVRWIATTTLVGLALLSQSSIAAANNPVSHALQSKDSLAVAPAHCELPDPGDELTYADAATYFRKIDDALDECRAPTDRTACAQSVDGAYAQFSKLYSGIPTWAFQDVRTVFNSANLVFLMWEPDCVSPSYTSTGRPLTCATDKDLRQAAGAAIQALDRQYTQHVGDGSAKTPAPTTTPTPMTTPTPTSSQPDGGPSLRESVGWTLLLLLAAVAVYLGIQHGRDPRWSVTTWTQAARQSRLYLGTTRILVRSCDQLTGVARALPQAGSQRKVNAERWRRAVATFNEVEAAYAAYLHEPAEIFHRPLLDDVTEPPTAAFLEAFHTATSLCMAFQPKDADYIDRFQAAAQDARLTWDVADAHARRIGLGSRTDTERRKLRQAQEALALALDESSTADERSTALRTVRRLVDGILELPPRISISVLGAIESGARGEVLAGRTQPEA